MFVCLFLFVAPSTSAGALSLDGAVSDEASREEIRLDAFAWPLPLLLSRVMPTVRRGLDKRVKLVTALTISQDSRVSMRS